jgi:hypothetical protein
MTKLDHIRANEADNVAYRCHSADVMADIAAKTSAFFARIEAASNPVGGSMATNEIPTGGCYLCSSASGLIAFTGAPRRYAATASAAPA